MLSLFMGLVGKSQNFSINAISDSLYNTMLDKSYKKGCPVPRSSLRYLTILHYDANGQVQKGELVCHEGVAKDLIDIFKQLYKAQYPIESVKLIDNYGAVDEISMEANNTSCFNFRPVKESRKLSVHSQGRAIDINPLYNPCVRKKKDGTLMVNPIKGKKYVNRNKSFRYKIEKGDLCYKLFISHGFQWGGNWRSLKDYQHFEKE